MANTTLKGYKLDFVNNELVMNYTFAAAAEQYGTPENKLLKKIQKDFPKLTIVVKSGRQQKTSKKNKRLTYENMKKHLSVYENSKELLDLFEVVKMASLASKSPYKFMCTWFVKQCPNYSTPNETFRKLELVPLSKIETDDEEDQEAA